MRIACAGLHRGEEPPVAGESGSGTIFFTGCTLRCPYCQNYQISREGAGTEVSIERFSSLCINLQRMGAENINLVTGGHFAPSIALGIALSRRNGLSIPVVWNSSGYDSQLILDLLSDVIDIYLPDCKALSETAGRAVAPAADYGSVCVDAVSRMVVQKPLLLEGGLLKQGTIVRHLVLPGKLDNTEEVLRTFAAFWRGKALLSLMVQFEPMENRSAKLWHEKHRIPFRKITRGEYNMVLAMLDDYDIEDGFIQELSGATEWLPDFNYGTVFPSSEFTPLWHWGQE
jgi:putative pyruvate formate lyase activating enzyme